MDVPRACDPREAERAADRRRVGRNRSIPSGYDVPVVGT